MELKVYDWEYFERGKTWYIVFAFVILAVVVLSVLSSNLPWWVIVLLFAAGYLYFSLRSNKTVSFEKKFFKYEKLYISGMNWDDSF